MGPTLSALATPRVTSDNPRGAAGADRVGIVTTLGFRVSCTYSSA